MMTAGRDGSQTEHSGPERGSPVSRAGLLEALSALLLYPRGDFSGTLAEFPAGPDGGDAPAARLIAAFAAGVSGLTQEEVEELYTRTFDLNPAASLETGWQLYGEAYERGAFLVKMREMLRRYGVPEGNDLPDHLSSVLAAMAKMPGEEADALAASHIRGAVAKMIAAFPDGGNPYIHLLRAASLAACGNPARKENAQP